MSYLSGWFLAAGAMLLLMALLGAAIERLPVSGAIVYLVCGWMLGRGAFGLLDADPALHFRLVESIAEIALAVSIFSIGLRLGVPLGDPAWRVPLRLAGPALVVTIALAAVAAWWVLGLGWAAALLLAAIVAPTDPVLASDIQLKRPTERDRVRFGLTAEGGLNEGLVAAGVLLALAVLGPRDAFLRSVAVDVFWPVPAGLAVGWLCGTVVTRFALELRRRNEAPAELEVFLVLGLVGLAYGAASLIHGEGFLAVFAAGLAVRRLERKASARAGANAAGQAAEGEPAAMAYELLTFNRQVERMAEVVVVVVAGVLLATVAPDWRAVAFAAIVLLLVRPLSVGIGLAGAHVNARERHLLQWFGVRGIGSLYWLAFALNRGPELDGVAETLAEATLAVIAGSILAHGISATPVMDWYLRRRKRRR